MRIVLIFSLLLLLFGCDADSATTKKTQPLNTPKEAIETYLKTKQFGWTYKGDTLEKPLNITATEQFDIHLEKDKETKVVTVIIKKFQHFEGQEYWLVYEATKLEIAKARLKEEFLQQLQDEEQARVEADREPYSPR